MGIDPLALQVAALAQRIMELERRIESLEEKRK